MLGSQLAFQLLDNKYNDIKTLTNLANAKNKETKEKKHNSSQNSCESNNSFDKIEDYKLDKTNKKSKNKNLKKKKANTNSNSNSNTNSNVLNKEDVDSPSSKIMKSLLTNIDTHYKKNNLSKLV